MPYGFNEDRSKYELQSGGGGVQPMFVNMVMPVGDAPHLDKTAREIYEHVSQGGMVIGLDALGSGDASFFVLTCMYRYIDSGLEIDEYRLYFGTDTPLVADTLDDYPHMTLS